LRAATGDVVAFLNADDIYKPGALALVAESFNRRRDKIWLVGGCSIIDHAGREFHSLITSYKRFLLRNFSYPLLLIENFICQPAVFWRRDVLESVGYLSEIENLVMDYDYWLRIARVGGAPIIVDNELAGFRRIEGTKSNTSYVKQFRDDLRISFASAKLSVCYWWTMPLKLLGYLRTVIIYRFLYR
jgi:GT2 family glycosyltransferase